MEVVINLILTLCTGFALIYGLLHRSRAIYVQLLASGAGVMMLGSLFQMLCTLTGIDISGRFHVGYFSMVGTFMFFFSANYGQMDSLIDLPKEKAGKYSLLSFAAVIPVLLLYIAVLLSECTMAYKISALFPVVFIALSEYYSFKLLICPDVEGGVIRSIRPSNALLCIFGLGCSLHLAGGAYQSLAISGTGRLVMAAVAAALIPVLLGGVRKWTT
ncbi:MAG: hypothetical protein HUJ76_11715 [Parasporobacterium sp.]|nr:hypothetical protein [Parasporobacterium sp.]